MNKIILAIVIVGIGVVSFFVFSGSVSQSLTAEDFRAGYSNTPEAVLLDVRTPAEFTQGHIEKAINVDFESASFKSDIQELDPAKHYFVYCRSGNRSAQAIRVMRELGFANITELSGGIVAWEKARFPLY